MEKIEMNRMDLTIWKDFQFKFFGRSECQPLHYYGPGTKPYFIIHFVLHGKGIFKIGNASYSLSRGDVFLIEPNQMVFYQADQIDPWAYVWVGIDGENCRQLLQSIGLSHPIVVRSLSSRVLSEIELILEKMNTQPEMNELMKNGQLLTILGFIQSDNYVEDVRSLSAFEHPLTNQSKYVEMCIAIIKERYTEDLSVNNLALELSINRAYLSQLFKKQVGMSLKEYINDFRISMCQELLYSTSWSIEEIAREVGFNSLSYFSKVFKKKYGISPSHYRKKRYD